MFYRLIAGVFLLIALAAHVPRTATAATIIASNTGPTGLYSGVGGAVPTNSHQGQTFASTADGTLETISLLLTAESDPLDPGGPLGVGGEDVVISLYSTSGGLPDSLLGSATVLESAIPTTAQSSGTSVTADFSSQSILLLTGVTYAFAASTPTAATFPNSRYWFMGSTSNPFSGGSAVSSVDDGATWSLGGSGTWDRNFEVAVTIVPEPTTALLFATGLAGLAVRRRGLR